MSVAKYALLYSCGHEGMVVVDGRSRATCARLEALEQRACPACLARTQTPPGHTMGGATRTEPALRGTRTRVAWAVDIRQEVLAQLQALPVRDPQGVALLYAALRAHTDASWWIDHREVLATPQAVVVYMTAHDAALRAYACRRRT
jgi:hypothetical protein